MTSTQDWGGMSLKSQIKSIASLLQGDDSWGCYPPFARCCLIYCCRHHQAVTLDKQLRNTRRISCSWE
jgi:hypothetical protein